MTPQDAPARTREGTTRSADLDFLVAYGDLESGVQGRRVCDALVRDHARKSHAQLAMWDFSRVGGPGVGLSARRKAEQADVIVVCVPSGEVLPQAVQTWLHDWMGRLSRRRRGLILVTGPRVSEEAAFAALRERIEGWAEEAGVSFLCVSFPGDGVSGPVPGSFHDGLAGGAEVVRPATSVAPMRLVEGQAVHPFRRGGINE